jgi:urease accessory protein
MLGISQRLIEPRPPDAFLVLPFELRSRSRLRARLTTGEEAGIVLPRGQVLRGGDLLLAADGRVIQVEAASETVSTVHSGEAGPLARAAYHLGNRHVALQIGAAWLRYGHDHVLDDMVRGLGLVVAVEQAPFEPEGGAYHHGRGHGSAAHHHADGHAHHHDHDHGHAHDHAHDGGH